MKKEKKEGRLKLFHFVGYCRIFQPEVLNPDFIAMSSFLQDIGMNGTLS